MSEPRVSRRSPFLLILVFILALECAALVAIFCFLVFELLVERPDSVATAIALLFLDLIAAVWVGAMAVHALRGRAWIRGGAVTWQIVQIAVGFGSLQAPYSRPDIGSLLILPAVAALILLFTPSVRYATRRRGEVTQE